MTVAPIAFHPSVLMADTTKTGADLRVTSHNVQGLNSPRKRRIAFEHYRSLKLDVVLFQETHFPIRYNPKFLHSHYPTFYLAHAANKTKGVAILFILPRLRFKRPRGQVYSCKRHK